MTIRDDNGGRQKIRVVGLRRGGKRHAPQVPARIEGRRRELDRTSARKKKNPKKHMYAWRTGSYLHLGSYCSATRKASENQTYILKVLEVFLSSVCVGQGVSQGVGQGVRTFVRRPVGDFTQSLVYGSFWLKRTTSLLL